MSSEERFSCVRATAEWSTLPTLLPADREEEYSAFTQLKLNTEEEEEKGTYYVCHKVNRTVLERAVVAELPSISQETKHLRGPPCSAAVESRNDSISSGNHSLISSSSSTVPQRHSRHEQSSNPQIPMALVTPLPGTSPPRQESEYLQCSHTIRVEPDNTQSQRECKMTEQWLHEECPKASVNPVELMEKWKSLIDVKDAILKQKSLQIERQKSTISKMEQNMCELEAKLHHQIVTQVHQHSPSVLEARLQALEAENSSIKSQLAEALSSQNKELCTLSNRLDHKEFELRRAVISHEESSGRRQQMIASLQVKISTQQSCIRELEQKLAGSDAAIEHHIEQIDRLTKYMRHVPSIEEHQSLERQNRDMQMKCDILAKRLAEVESALKGAQQMANEKEVLIQSQEHIKGELENTRLNLDSHKKRISILESENIKLKEESQHLHKVVVEAERRCRQELQAMRERHRTRFVEATAKLRTQYKGVVKRARALESQLAKNSEAMVALNVELQSSQGTIGALKTSVKDLVSQNQELLEKNISLQESTSEAVKISSCFSEAQSSAAQQLCVELSQCTEEIESLVGLSVSLLKGQEPNPTILFGSDCHALSSDDDVFENLDSRLAQAKSLRCKTEELRSIISEHFATKLSSVCNVQ